MPSSNKTANLNLNQWAATDGVCRGDFNSDNHAIDTAIGAMPIRKLKEVTTTAAAATVEISLSDIDMSQYSEIWMDIRLGFSWAVGNTAWFRLNNISSANYNDSVIISDAVQRAPTCAELRFYTGLHRFVLGDTLCVFKPNFAYWGEISAATLPPSNWTSITFIRTGGQNIPVGGKVKIYGVKKV